MRSSLAVGVLGLVVFAGIPLVACGESADPTSDGSADSGDVPSSGEAGADAARSEDASSPADAEGRDGDAPAPVRVGWEVSATNVGLAGIGLACDALPRYAGPEKPARGAVISGQRVESALDLSSGDIVIERSCVRPNSVGRGLPVLSTTDFNRCNDNDCPVAPALVTIRDSEIDGTKLSTESAAWATGFLGVATIQRTYIHHFGSGIGLMNTGDELSAEIVNNYVTDLVGFGDPATTGNHSDGFTIRDFDVSKKPGRALLVKGNRFDCDSINATGALFIQTYAGDIANARIEDNLLEGDGYQLALEAQRGNTYANLTAINNRFSGTSFGATYRTGGPGWTSWKDNHIHDPGAPDHKGKLVDQP